MMQFRRNGKNTRDCGLEIIEGEGETSIMGKKKKNESELPREHDGSKELRRARSGFQGRGRCVLRKRRKLPGTDAEKTNNFSALGFMKPKPSNMFSLQM